jgi:putative transposase
VVGWLPLFTKPELAGVVLSSLRFLHDEKRIVLHSYVLMENHLHFIGSSDEFSNELRNFKSFTAKKIVESMSSPGSSFYLKQMRFLKKQYKTTQTYQVWQEGFHPVAIVNEETLRQKTDYIHFNPLRRGYVDYPEQWRYSSARDYSEQKGAIPIEIIF